MAVAGIGMGISAIPHRPGGVLNERIRSGHERNYYISTVQRLTAPRRAFPSWSRKLAITSYCESACNQFISNPLQFLHTHFYAYHLMTV